VAPTGPDAAVLVAPARADDGVRAPAGSTERRRPAPGGTTADDHPAEDRRGEHE
jgi:hypothetical protein